MAGVVLAAVLVAVSACSGTAEDDGGEGSGGETSQVTDAMGREVTIPAHPERVFLGGQRLLYTTAFLDKEDPTEKVVAWPDDLEENDPGTYEKYTEKFPQIADIPKTGEVYDGSMSLEQALESRPDVFVVSAANFDAAKEAGLVDGLEKAGVPVVAVDYFTDPIKNTVPSIELMGTIFGHEKEAEDFVDYYQSKVDMVTERLEKAGEPKTPTFLWRAPGYFDCCSTFAKSNLASIVDAAGGENIGDGMIDGKQGQVSPEALVGKDPDVIIATGADWAPGKTPVKEGGFVPLGYNEPADKAAKDLQTVVDGQPAVKEMRAVKDKRTFAAWHHFYDSPYNYLAIEWFAKAMHPDLFEDVDPAAELEELHEKFLPIEASGTFWTGLP